MYLSHICRLQLLAVIDECWRWFFFHALATRRLNAILARLLHLPLFRLHFRNCLISLQICLSVCFYLFVSFYLFICLIDLLCVFFICPSSVCPSVRSLVLASPRPKWMCSAGCLSDQFRCESSGSCIPQSQKCDGIVDCPNREDEDASNCLSPLFPFPPPPAATTTTTTTTTTTAPPPYWLTPAPGSISPPRLSSSSACLLLLSLFLSKLLFFF